ncbi:MAG TPA: hypothetical protein DER56_06640 [Thermosipho africanus]|nr:hypothetical protein [Thermosipho africanus]
MKKKEAKKTKEKKETKKKVRRSKTKDELELFPLHTFKMCEQCQKECKISGIQGAKLEFCPDFKEVVAE